MANKFISDVRDFMVKFGVNYNGGPRLLPEKLREFRINFLKEEFNEYCAASNEDNLEGMLDALVDLVYVVIGTSLMHGFDFENAWNRIHYANMHKVKVSKKSESKRNTIYDVVKPDNWNHPNLKDLVCESYKHKKPDWDLYFLDFLPIIAARATCSRGRNSALIVDEENQVVSTGYVGAPPKALECDDVGHLLIFIRTGDKETQHCIRSSHAEMNAIAQAAKRGVSTKNCTLYTKIIPCWDCAKLITTCGIKKVVCLYDYHRSDNTKKLFKESDIELKIKNEGCFLYHD